MTQIRDSIELDFCDVLFQPKRTTLNSRKEADVIREYKFKYYPHHLMSCGIRSTMAYIGARRLKDIPKCTTFYRVNRQLNEVFGKS